MIFNFKINKINQVQINSYTNIHLKKSCHTEEKVAN